MEIFPCRLCFYSSQPPLVPCWELCAAFWRKGLARPPLHGSSPSRLVALFTSPLYLWFPSCLRTQSLSKAWRKSWPWSSESLWWSSSLSTNEGRTVKPAIGASYHGAASATFLLGKVFPLPVPFQCFVIGNLLGLPFHNDWAPSVAVQFGSFWISGAWQFLHGASVLANLSSIKWSKEVRKKRWGFLFTPWKDNSFIAY